jgi:hypothetical protein
LAKIHPAIGRWLHGRAPPGLDRGAPINSHARLRRVREAATRFDPDRWLPWHVHTTPAGHLLGPAGVKEQTPLPPLLRSHPQDSFHGGSFGVSGTPPTKPLMPAAVRSRRCPSVGNGRERGGVIRPGCQLTPHRSSR